MPTTPFRVLLEQPWLLQLLPSDVLFALGVLPLVYCALEGVVLTMEIMAMRFTLTSTWLILLLTCNVQLTSLRVTAWLTALHPS